MAEEPRSAGDLQPAEIRRYARHLVLPEVGMDGQRRLKAARVLCVGTGGLGSPVSMYLAAAGVGHLTLVDFDVVDDTNLQRQVLYTTADVGRPKLDAARERLQGMNPFLSVESVCERFTSANALDLVRAHDVVVDGTDNFQTRYLVNDACALAGKPNVYGSIFRMEGQASVFHAAQGPCYRCLYPEPPPPGLVPSCAEGGVLGVLPGIIGCIQAAETVKLILGQGEPLIGRLLLFDALRMRFREMKLRKDPNCPLCGENPTLQELVDYEAFCGLDAGVAQRMAVTAGALEVSPADLDRLREAGTVALLDVREPPEWRICDLDGARHIPLGDLPRRMHELDTAAEIVAYCHHGVRSLQAVLFLRQHGFAKVKSLRGGLEAWARSVDPSMPRY